MKREADIGVMGGMFDPVHNGHLRSALEALASLALDEVRLLPCGSPPHRGAARTDCGSRLAMLRLACAGEERLCVDGRECAREGTSYSFDTLTSLKEEFPAARLYLMLGADAFNSLPAWHRWREIFGLAHLVVFARPGWQGVRGGELGGELDGRLVSRMDDMKASGAGKVLLCEQTPLEISSSHIRELISLGKSARYLLPDAVWDYIQANRLYSRA